MKKMVVFCMLSMFLSGCDTTSKNSEPPVLGGNEVKNSNAFSDYLKIKNIPENNQDRVLREKDSYEQKNKLMGSMLAESVLDKSLIEAEVLEYKKQLVSSRYFETFVNNKVDDQAIKNYYATNAEKYESEKINIAHILIRTNQKMSKEELTALSNKAHEVYSRATSGEDFDSLAKSYSDDKISAKKGGDLGWIKEGAIDKAFSKKVFTMDQGSISKPITTPYGFHVVKVISPSKTIKQPFDSVKGDIRYQLRQLAKQAEIQRLLQKSSTEKN